MELKATSLGKHLAQHPYNRVTLLNAGINVAGDKHEYLIPFNQLIAVNCKRGLVWGELEFVLPDNNVVRLHGTEWGETQRFYRHLSERWQTWSQSMSDVAARALDELVAMLNKAAPPDQWLRLEQVERLAQLVVVVLRAFGACCLCGLARAISAAVAIAQVALQVGFLDAFGVLLAGNPGARHFDIGDDALGLDRTAKG